MNYLEENCVTHVDYVDWGFAVGIVVVEIAVVVAAVEDVAIVAAAAVVVVVIADDLDKDVGGKDFEMLDCFVWLLFFFKT